MVMLARWRAYRLTQYVNCTWEWIQAWLWVLQCLQIELNGNVSSQYLTAILMAAPLAEGEGYTEIICKDLISQPYVYMTVRLMGYFNIEVVFLHNLFLMFLTGDRWHVSSPVWRGISQWDSIITCDPFHSEMRTPLLLLMYNEWLRFFLTCFKEDYKELKIVPIINDQVLSVNEELDIPGCTEHQSPVPVSSFISSWSAHRSNDSHLFQHVAWHVCWSPYLMYGGHISWTVIMYSYWLFISI